MSCPTKVCFYTLLFFNASSAVADTTTDLLSMSLEDLTNIKVSTGSLLSNIADESPSAITIIRRNQIELSGAKNLANLLEQHVPGLMVMTHSEGDKIGLRGLIAAENYKLLLLVNGKNITNMVYEGAILEIDQWDMGDIEKVEVIRGPGSVTYGTGAIAGIINIITKTAEQAPTFSFTATRNDTYRSSGLNAQYAHKSDNLKLYGFASYRATQGYQNPDYFVLNPNEPTDIRWVGKGSTDQTGPQDYLADGLERPQIKAHLGLDINEHFNAWLRYTQSGQTRAFTKKRYDGNDGTLNNGRSTGTRSFIASSDYQLIFSDVEQVKTSLTFDSQEYIRWDFGNPASPQQSVDNIRDYAFSQDRLKGSILYDYAPSSEFNFVVGFEYNNTYVHAPWGKSADHLWIREGVHIINNAKTSVYLQDDSLNGRPQTNNVLEVGRGLHFETYTQLFEGRYQLQAKHQLFYAHRVDFPNVTGSMFSPRVSLVSKFDEANTLVSVLQRAQRMMPLRAQYLNYKFDGGSSHETLDSIEFSYTNKSLDNTSLNLRAFYNEISAVGFTGEKLEFLTDVELYGVEFLANYKFGNFNVTVNHTFLNTLNVEMNDSQKTGNARNNISYADYYYFTRSEVPILLESYGEGLNNWSNNATKLLISTALFDEQLTLHINAQLFWDLDGSYDELQVYQQGYNNTDTTGFSAEQLTQFEQQKTQFERERDLIKESGAFKHDLSVNFSLNYRWAMGNDTEAMLKLFVENAFASKRRYNVSTGSNRFYPERLNFMDEPTMFGISFSLLYQ